MGSCQRRRHVGGCRQDLPSDEAPVDRIRVLMISMPRLQADVIRTALAAEPTVEVVGDVPRDRARDAVASTGAQVAIVGDTDALPASALDLLAAHPGLKVLGVTGAAGQAVLYECLPVATRLGEASPRLLVEAILGARPRCPEVPR
jgi:hypothetical protein